MYFEFTYWPLSASLSYYNFNCMCSIFKRSVSKNKHVSNFSRNLNSGACQLYLKKENRWKRQNSMNVFSMELVTFERERDRESETSLFGWYFFFVFLFLLLLIQWMNYANWWTETDTEQKFTIHLSQAIPWIIIIILSLVCRKKTNSINLKSHSIVGMHVWAQA